MSIKNVVSSLFLLLLLTACENRAQPVEEEVDVQNQEQFQQGNIATHSEE